MKKVNIIRNRCPHCGGSIIIDRVYNVASCENVLDCCTSLSVCDFYIDCNGNFHDLKYNDENEKGNRQ